MKVFRISFVLAAHLTIGCIGSRADILDSWTTNLISTTNATDCVVFGNGRYVAYGEISDYGYLYSSEDGFNWTPRTPETVPAPLSFCNSLVYSGGKFFALGGFGTSAASNDGTNWTIFSLPPMYDLASWPNGVIYVAVGDTISVSNDGTNWSGATFPSLNGAKLIGVAFGNNQFVAIDNANHTYVSQFGDSWNRFNMAGGTSISFANGRFIVPSQAGTNLISTDGMNWTPLYTGLTNQLGKITSANHLLMALAGKPYTSNQYFATSIDGTNWTQYPHVLPGQSIVANPRFATDGSRIVLVAGNPPTPGYGLHSGYAYTSDLLVDLNISNAPVPTLLISGLIGSSNQIEYRDSLPVGGSTWQSLTNVQLPSSPWIFVDTTATNSIQRFYRVRLQP